MLGETHINSTLGVFRLQGYPGCPSDLGTDKSEQTVWNFSRNENGFHLTRNEAKIYKMHSSFFIIIVVLVHVSSNCSSVVQFSIYRIMQNSKINESDNIYDIITSFFVKA